MKKTLLISFVCTVLVAMGVTGVWLIHIDLQSQQLTAENQTDQPITSPSSNLLGTTTEVSYLLPQTKTSDCHANGPLPDFECTPGAVFATVTKEEVCTPGYSKKVRNVSQKTKNQVYAMYGIVSHTTGEYEVDHLISLQLGGSNQISNLWPEPEDPALGYKQKDKVENYLHSQLCAGLISLPQAQKIIATDWQSVYEQLGQLKDQ